MPKEILLLSEFGKRLGTRAEGEKARAKIFAKLSALAQGSVLVVDLTGVEVLSGSFADEALGEILTKLKAGELPGRYLLIKTPSWELVEDLELKLSQRGVAVLALKGEEARALGQVPPQAASCLELILKRGEIRSTEVAEALGITVRHASVLLSQLSQLGLVHRVREARPKGGVQNRYLSLLLV